MRKVRIKGLPNKSQGGTYKGVNGGAMDGLRRFLEGKKNYDQGMNQFAQPPFEVNETLPPVPEDQANIEAEKGEQAVVPGSSGIPESYTVGGKRHSEGGTPLNLAEDSFIFSDHKKGKKGEKGMKIKDKDILAEFGVSVPKKGKVKGKTPADLAKKFKLNEYKRILLDPTSDRLERETAEMMIKNNNSKLAKLALVQESMKGFPQGIPQIAMPYLSQIGSDGSEFVPQSPQELTPPMAAYGAGVLGDAHQYSYMHGGAYVDNNKMAKRFPGLNIKQEGGPFTITNPEMIKQAEQQELQERLQHQQFVMDYAKQANLTPEQTAKLVWEQDELLQSKSFAPQFYDGGATKGSSEFSGKFWDSILKYEGGGEYGVFINKYQEGGNFEPHMMFDPMTGESMMANTYEEHLQLGNTGYIHEDEMKFSGAKKYQDGGSQNFVSFTGEDGKRYTYKNGMIVPLDGGTSGGTEQIQDEPKKGTTVPTQYKDNAAYDMGSPNFDAGILKEGDYYKTQDGQWRKVTYVPENITYQGTDLNTTFHNNNEVANAYAFLENSFQDPEVKAEFANATRGALANKEYYKGKSGGYSEMYTEEEIANLSDDEIVNTFLTHQRRNYSLQAWGIDPKDFQDANGNLRGKDAFMKNKTSQINVNTGQPYTAEEAEQVYQSYQDMGIGSLNDAFAMTGVPITADEEQSGALGLQQGTYWGYHDLLANKGNLSPELQDKLQYFHEPQEGFGDEPLNKFISPIDSKNHNFYTNTTAGHLAVVDQGNLESEAVDIAPEPTPDIPIEDPEFVQHVPRDEWWAQDIGNIANLFGQRMALQKYLPHSFPIDLQRPDVLYFDPSRALAANAEQANIAAQATTAFAGPQATYRLSGIAGDAFKNAANVLADYEGKNVQVGNQYLQNVAQTANQEALANAERAQRLYDQTTVANQQFDNAKRETNRNLFEAWRQGLTNKKMTQAMNALYPQFETIPSIGGGLYYTGVERPFTDTGSNGSAGGNDQYLAEFEDLKSKYPNASDSAIKGQLDRKYGNRPLTDPYADAKNFYRGAFPPGMFGV